MQSFVLQQRRPPSSGRSQDAKPAPEVRIPGLSAMGAGNNIMEELRKAAMARAKQASAKPQAVRRLYCPHLAFRGQGAASSAEGV